MNAVRGNLNMAYAFRRPASPEVAAPVSKVAPAAEPTIRPTPIFATKPATAPTPRFFFGEAPMTAFDGNAER
jgi:hypothetical protein